MTGIGNYCFHILKALVNSDDLDFWGFTGFAWQKLEPGLFSALELARYRKEIDDARPSWTARTKLAIRSRLQNVEIARQLYKNMRARRFSRDPNSSSLSVFHAFRYLPPAELSVPVLPVVYDLSFERYPNLHPRDRRKQLTHLANVISAAPMVQTISEFSKIEIATLYDCPADKIFVAPPAPATIFVRRGEHITTAGLTRFSLRYKNYFLCVGTLEPRKNLRTLIAAYSTLSASQRASFPLIIVGNTGWGELALPPDTTRLIRAGELRFLSHISDPELRHLYEGAAALVYPSLYEGFGMPVVEAFACGTRVAHSGDTAMDEITQGLAVRVAAMDVDGWREALRYFEGNPERTDTEANRRITRANQFTWQHSTKIVHDAYLRLPVEGRGAEPRPND